MPKDQSTTPARAKRESRSRKGCPECRRRKIKCDEKQPECGQCLKSGRFCRILDSLFKPHSYSFAVSEQSTQPADEENPIQKGGSETKQTVHDGLFIGNVTQTTANTQPPVESLASKSKIGYVQSSPKPQSDLLHSAMHEKPSASILDSHGEETYQDRCEIAFFLRHFSEGPGQWMDFCGGQSYFSQNAVVLAHWSPLFRYAACALGAKQLGQTRHPESQIRQTRTQGLMMNALIDTKLGFTWYGAKYYEKAIKLLAKQISANDKSSHSMSPSYIYGLGSTPEQRSRDGSEDLPYQILAASIMSQYEDVNATINAWSGHLDGAFRLFRPHAGVVASFQACRGIPQPTRALDAVFWFAVANDMLNSFVTRRKTRIDPHDLSLWREMGLPLDDMGDVVMNMPLEPPVEILLFKALIHLMCQLVNADLTNGAEMASVNQKFDTWQSSVPESFYIPITWPPADSNPTVNDPFQRETWFGSDTSAITLAFYHMARMILLTNRPVDSVVSQPRSSDNSSNDALQQDLRKHAMEIIPIMNAMPNETVQKHMLQPLYIAGRCLTDENERRELLRVLQGMSDDFGLFTDYRIQDLCGQWGMSCSGIDRRDGHGILT